MALWTEWIWAEESGGQNFTENAVVNLGGSYGVYASVALSQFNGQGSNPQGQIYISGYVQNGKPYAGNWNELIANGISSVTVSVTVNNALAKGVLTITTDR
jgi:hypothetical protein